MPTFIPVEKPKPDIRTFRGSTPPRIEPIDYLGEDEIRRLQGEEPSPVTRNFNKVPSTTRTDRLASGPSQDLDRLLAAAQGSVAAEFDAELEQLRAEFDARLAAAGGGGDFGISEAQAQLADVRANRAALSEIYLDVLDVTQGYGDEAVQAALDIIGQATPAFEEIAAETEAGLAAAEASAGDVVQDVGELIGAGEAAIVSAKADALEGFGLFQEFEQANAETVQNLLGLEAAASKEAAEAEQALFHGEMSRRALLMDTEFRQREEQAAMALAAARRAAAAAAARRRALAKQRDAAIAALEDEKIRSLKLNPHEAGVIASLDYLKNNADHLDFRRQQLVASTLENAISENVTSPDVRDWLTDKNLIGAFSNEEVAIVTQGLVSYTAGERYQQFQDRTPVQRLGLADRYEAPEPLKFVPR